MFSAGTKVSVCCSAISGKKMGPKCHSLGYISGSSTAHYINYNKMFPIKNQSFIIFPLTIIFTRYGKETKQRCEARSFLQLVPASADPPSTVKSKKIEEIISILKGDELSKNPLWYDIACNYSNEPSHIGVAIPTNSKGVSRLEGNEARAWIISILRCEPFRNLIMKNRHLPTLRAMISSDLLVWISNAVKGSNPRRDLLSWADDEQGNMEALLAALRRLMTTFDKRMHINSLRDIKHHFGSGNIDTNAYVTWLVGGMFDDVIFKSKLKMADGLPIGNSLRNITKNLETTRSVYQTLSPKYI